MKGALAVLLILIVCDIFYQPKAVEPVVSAEFTVLNNFAKATGANSTFLICTKQMRDTPYYCSASLEYGGGSVWINGESEQSALDKVIIKELSDEPRGFDSDYSWYAR